MSAELVEKLDEPGRTFARNIQAASPEDRADTLDRVMTGNPEKDAIVAAILATDTEEPVAEEHGGYPVYSLDERCEEDNEPDWVVDGVAQRGGLTVVTGAPGSKKTYLMMYMGMCTATCQTTWLGRAIVPGKVLFIDEESGERRNRRRAREIRRGTNLPYPDKQFMITNLVGCNLLRPEHIQKLDETLARENPALAIVDAFADVMAGGDENSVKDTQPVFMALRQLAEKHKVAIIVVHHTNKQGGYRGSSAIPGAVDTLLMVKSEKESPNVEITTEKARDAEHFRISAAVSFVTYPEKAVRFVLTDAPEQREHPKGKGEQFVIKYLSEHRKATKREIADAPDAWVSAKTVVNCIGSLLEKQLVRPVHASRASGGKGNEQEYELAPAPVELPARDRSIPSSASALGTHSGNLPAPAPYGRAGERVGLLPPRQGRLRAVRVGLDDEDRQTVCWKCGVPLDSFENEPCPDCGWLVCSKCNSCSKECDRCQVG